MAVKTLLRYFWLKKNKLIFFMPTPKRFYNIRKNIPILKEINTDKKITCYWVSTGTWGAYKLPNKIYICPWENYNIISVIKHELAHLKYGRRVEGMSYDEKESFIVERSEYPPKADRN